MTSEPRPTSPADAVERLVRDEYPRILATLIRVTGDVGMAEDAVQEAVIRALRSWPRDGVPTEPRAWLTVAARRCAIDRVRREAVRDEKEGQAVWLLDTEPAEPSESVVRDDLLRLVFTCCHPTLSLEAQVALSLRTLGGLSTAEVARALLVPEATMAKRLTRAKQKIRQAQIPYRVPPDAELPGRLQGVLSTVYLIFNEGYATSSGTDAVRQPLVDEALRLGRLLHDLMPDEASVTGLLALMLLQDSRRDTRTGPDGVAVPPRGPGPHAVGRGRDPRGRRTGRRRPSSHPFDPDPFVVQAAIAACHALAPDVRRHRLDSDHLVVRRAPHGPGHRRRAARTGRCRRRA